MVDKPAGWTSHDVVARSRGLLGTRKVGHSGTLDPDATGVLVLGVGRATRLLRYLTALGKTYEAEIVLGTETTTLDAAGEVTATHDMTGVTLVDARRIAAEALTGPILQVPPMVSAIKVDGRRLHELAREGIEVERQARPVTVYSFTLDEVPDVPGVLRAAVACSSGTYVRTLAADLGHLLGGGAHLRALRRTAVGGYTIADAVPLDALGPDRLLPMTAAVAHLDQVAVDGDIAVAVGHGKVLARADLGVDRGGDGPWAVTDAEGALRAVYIAHRDDTVKPELVIAP
ncbi:tRNA pseudouridine(55) synthase TruB [Iamia sp.]|uniref:tRNA pseudouridine(55) synthase TruB n=1 Tax=Iamia sp. TaxID=2722710 RepID=UPI002CFA0195|nr:tRNA pseudouridine(55) synthase TruB [Iamia sp.]HXH56903.1 tRNA pseudouridine(55) synthase TruB [Iamia sp.]